MQEFSATPLELLTCLWRNRSLIIVSSKREVQGRYRGSLLGLLWSFINPLFILTVYTFVFSVIFEARWENSSGSKTEFALLLFAGLLMFNLFVETITSAPTLILSNTNYVKKVIFPLEILPFVRLVTALFHTVVSVMVWIIAYLIFIGIPHPTIMLLPIVLLPYCMFLLGLSWMLASLGVFLRDISQFIGILTTALMFLSPIFYPVTSFPADYRFILYLNPLTTVVNETRNILFWGITPNLFALGVYFIATYFIAWVGFFWFQKTRRGFADVL